MKKLYYFEGLMKCLLQIIFLIRYTLHSNEDIYHTKYFRRTFKKVLEIQISTFKTKYSLPLTKHIQYIFQLSEIKYSLIYFYSVQMSK